MDIDLCEDTNAETPLSQGTAIIATKSYSSNALIAELLCELNYETHLTDDGNKLRNEFSKYQAGLFVMDLELPGVSGIDLLNDIGRYNLEYNSLTRVVVISADTSRETISKLLITIKKYRGHLKLGFLARPWKPQDLYRQIRNLYPQESEFQQQIEQATQAHREDDTFVTEESRLVLGVTEIEQGLRVELGCDREISVTSKTVKVYIEQVEKRLLSAPVNYIEFSLSALARVPPQNVIALLMLLSGLSAKWEKKIAFVEIPYGLYRELQNHGLGELIKK